MYYEAFEDYFKSN